MKIKYNLFLKDRQNNSYSIASGQAEADEITDHYIRNTFISDKCMVQNNCDSTGIAEFKASYVTFADTDRYIVISKYKASYDNEGIIISIYDTIHEIHRVTLTNTVNRKLVKHIINGLITYINM